MEERALYRAILAAPHDDAVRLAYADWLDEHADTLPDPAAERGRAEFIRLQCVTARRTAVGWLTPGRGPQPSPRERRLLFHHGKKWRRAFKPAIASAPFDRGFLRPRYSFVPQGVLYAPGPGPYSPFLPLPPDSPAGRYVPEDDGLFAVAPLWDLHLYAPGWLTDPLRDTGQYGHLLAEVAQSPALQRVGWLKVSFHRTSTFDFLRHGRFDNVETLVLNSGPFPGVLEAVALNESFRSLRYVQFGTDLWAWAPDAATRDRFATLKGKIDHLNAWHVQFGAMRAGLLRVLQTTPPPPPPPPLIVTPPFVLRLPQQAPAGPVADRPGAAVAWAVGAVWFVILLVLWLTGPPRGANSGASGTPGFKYQPPPVPEFKMPEFQPFDWKAHLERTKYSPYDDTAAQLKRHEELQALIKKMEKADRLPDGVPPWWPSPRLPTAPPPRAAERAVAPPPRAVEPDEK